ncbi:2151_t:CDS:2, partial [Racocetra fulgida]
MSELPKPITDSFLKSQTLSQGDSQKTAQNESENFILDPENSNDRKITSKKRVLDDDAFSQYGEISKATKYNHNDSIRTFWKSNTIHAKLYNERLDDRE